MNRLKSREVQIPNGFRYLQPETGFQPRRFSSFETIVNLLIAHRKGNQALIAKGYSTDHDTVANEVEAFNVRMCEQMGWVNFLTGDAGASPFPKPSAPSQQSQKEVSVAAGRVRKIWAGVRTINDWLDLKEASVPAAQAEARAATCAACAHNAPGDFTRWFTVPASEAIKQQLEKAAGRNLSTSQDVKLNICDVCLCPLKLNVHVPLALKLAHLSPEVERELRQVQPVCWVISEKDAK